MTSRTTRSAGLTLPGSSISTFESALTSNALGSTTFSLVRSSTRRTVAACKSRSRRCTLSAWFWSVRDRIWSRSIEMIRRGSS